MKDWESQLIQDVNIYNRWLFLDPEEIGRTQMSVISCWKDMLSMFKYLPDHIIVAHCRYIVSFNNHKIVGSTGHPKWFELSEVE